MEAFEVPERFAYIPHLAEIIEDEMRDRRLCFDQFVVAMGPFPSVHEFQVTYLAWKFFLTVRAWSARSFVPLRLLV